MEPQPVNVLKSIKSDIRAVFRWAIALNYRTESSNPADLHGSLGVLLEPYNKIAS